MKLLITGGAGFIGGNFIHYVLRNDPQDQVVCLDALTYAGNLETLADVMDDPNFTFVHGDISDRDAVYRLFEEEKPDVVVNFAAESHVDRSIENPGLFLHTNILGTGVLMDACRKYGIKRFHQVSTDEVYGDLPFDRPDLFLRKKRRCIPPAPTPPRRLRPTCWRWPITARSGFRSPSRAAPTITGPISSPKN